MPDKAIRKYYYQIKSWEGKFSTARSLSSVSMSAVIDRAFLLYEKTWDRSPDLIEVNKENGYTFN